MAFLDKSDWITALAIVLSVAYFVVQYTRLVPWWKLRLGRALVAANCCVAARNLTAIGTAALSQTGKHAVRDVLGILVAAAVITEALSLRSMIRERRRMKDGMR